MKAAKDMLGRRPFEHRSTFGGDRRRLINFRVSSQQQMTGPAATSAKKVCSAQLGGNVVENRARGPRRSSHVMGEFGQLESGLGEHERHRRNGSAMLVVREILQLT
ncbi:MAG: hypothetical protein JWP25_4251 [Bradyrhizobium sp.]|nr:hypothetical protein [Bradyrhizobium sp.]